MLLYSSPHQPRLCLHPAPRTKGTLDILCLVQTHSVSVGPHQALQLGPATFPQCWSSSPESFALREQSEGEKEGGREGRALKEQSLPSESVPHLLR